MFKQLIVGLILIACLVSLGVGSQARDQSSQSQPKPAGLIPPVYYDSLLNGLQILVVERPEQPEVTIGFMIKSGAAFDLVGREGATDLTAHMVLRKTQMVNDKPLAELFQDLNVSADVSVTWDATRFMFQAPARNLPQVFPVLAEILSRFTFPEGDLASLKQQRLAELRQRPVSPSDRTDLEFSRLVFARHPYARLVEGTVDSIEAITAADISRLHRRFYLANNAVLTVVGDVSSQTIMPLIRPTFGALRRGKIVPSTFTAPAKPTGIQVKVADQPNSKEAFIRLGYLVPSRASDEFTPLLLLNSALSRKPSPLDRVASAFPPERVTLTSHLDARALAGSFSIAATTPSPLAPAVISSLLKFIDSIRSEGINHSDLAAAKSYVIGNFPGRLRTNRQIVEQLQDIELYGLGRDYVLVFDQRIERVTPEQVKKVVADFFPTTDLYIAVTGPATEMMEELKARGTVEVVK
ncbi:MAG: insulinase family protein [Acidobacteria bacterium]|nr:insulinase family protein [Acidobacteriota bacterium]